MCWCNPNIRTPQCSNPECKPPEKRYVERYSKSVKCPVHNTLMKIFIETQDGEELAWYCGFCREAYAGRPQEVKKK